MNPVQERDDALTLGIGDIGLLDDREGPQVWLKQRTCLLPFQQSAPIRARPSQRIYPETLPDGYCPNHLDSLVDIVTAAKRMAQELPLCEHMVGVHPD